MTHREQLKGLSMQIQYLRERIAAADDECSVSAEENELHELEERLDALTRRTFCKR